MKAARLYEANKPLKIEKIPIPEIGSKDVLIEVKASIIDGTVSHFTRGRFAPPQLPITLGWETSGILANVGSEVTHLKKGDRVILNCIVWTCGKCYFCLTGRERICPTRGYHGGSLDGSFAEYVKASAENVFLLPENIPFDQGAVLSDSLPTAFNATALRGKIKGGDTVAIFGVGNVGMNAVQLANILGAAKVIAIDIADGKLQTAKQLGADKTVNATREDPVNRVRELTGGEGVDVAIECVGIKKTLEQTVQSTRRGGRAVFVGIGAGQNMEIDPLAITMQEIEVTGSWGYNRTVFPRLIEMVTSGRINLSKAISVKVSLENINEGIELLEKDKNIIGVLVEPK